MTREEAIEIIKDYAVNGCGYCHQGMAIEALSAEPCEDCISRAEAIKALTEYRDDLGGLGLFQICEDSYIYEKRTATDCIEIIENLPSQPKPIECEDCISRKAVDNLSRDLVHITRDKADFLCNFWEGLRKLPLVTSNPKTDVLDKIRAEIEQLRPNLRPEQMTDYDYAMVDVVNDIVAIIDKYRTESEE